MFQIIINEHKLCNYWCQVKAQDTINYLVIDRETSHDKELNNTEKIIPLINFQFRGQEMVSH